MSRARTILTICIMFSDTKNRFQATIRIVGFAKGCLCFCRHRANSGLRPTAGLTIDLRQIFPGDVFKPG